jgi:hypothetical protein
MNPSDMDGDLHEWGDMRAEQIKGLEALGYPQGEQGDFKSPSGRPPQPNYYPKHQIQALNKVIEELESKYQSLLIFKYSLKLGDREINRLGLCHYNTIPRWISEIKSILIKSKYWKC